MCVGVCVGVCVCVCLGECACACARAPMRAHQCVRRCRVNNRPRLSGQRNPSRKRCEPVATQKRPRTQMYDLTAVRADGHAEAHDFGWSASRAFGHTSTESGII